VLVCSQLILCRVSSSPNSEITAEKNKSPKIVPFFLGLTLSLESCQFGFFYLENHRKRAVDANKQERVMKAGLLIQAQQQVSSMTSLVRTEKSN